jgi:hypothetical protein
MSETISMTNNQFRRLLARFAAELEAKGGKMSDADIEQVAAKLVDDLASRCEVTGSSRVLNSNVAVKLG